MMNVRYFCVLGTEIGSFPHSEMLENYYQQLSFKDQNTQAQGGQESFSGAKRMSTWCH